MTAQNLSNFSFRDNHAREREPVRDTDRRRRLRPRDVLVRAAAVELLRQSIGTRGLEAARGCAGPHLRQLPRDRGLLREGGDQPREHRDADLGADWSTKRCRFPRVRHGRVSVCAIGRTRADRHALSPAPVVKIPGRASPQVLSGAWIGEGNAKPVSPGR